MNDGLKPGTNVFAASLALALMACPGGWAGAGTEVATTVPALWGYGVKPCSAFLATAPRDAMSTPIADEDYRRYREWLAGLVTGLNLATGRDVLRDAELDAAMLRIRAICKDHPEDDFFNASLRLVRSLGQLSGK